MSYVLFMR